MEFLRAQGYKLSYKDVLQLDGAFSAAHINYGKSPEFNGVDSKNVAKNSRKNSISSKNHIEDIFEALNSFNGTEKDFKKADRIELWKNYWLEYVNAFDKLTNILPKSIVTAYTGRQAIELGFKYLLVQKDVKEGELKTHDLKKLSDLLNSKNIFAEEYMEEIPDSGIHDVGSFAVGSALVLMAGAGMLCIALIRRRRND